MKSNNSWGKWGRLLLCLVGILWLSGCSNWELFHPDALEQDFGNSYHNNLAQQVVNPQAGQNNIPTAGLNPVAGVNEKTKYDNTFKAEEKKTTQMQVSF
jgi:hypothetical protein